MRIKDKRAVIYSFLMSVVLCIGIFLGGFVWNVTMVFIWGMSLFAIWAAIEIVCDSARFEEISEKLLDRPKWRVHLNRLFDVPILVLLAGMEWWWTLGIFFIHIVLTITAEAHLWEKE